MMLAHRMKKSPRYRRKTTKVCDKKKYTAARKQVVPLPEGHHHNRENIKRKRETVLTSELQKHSQFSRRCVFEAK